MTTLLHIDSSAKKGKSNIDQHGSHTRRLTSHFVTAWQNAQPDVSIIYRDLAINPPSFVTSEWIHAAFSQSAQRVDWMNQILANSNELVSEIMAADIIIVGVPMYNFGPPAQFKAYIDNIVRVGLTFGFDRSRSGEPYWPLLSEFNKKLVILSSRGDYGYNSGEHNSHHNHVESSIHSAFKYIGITDVVGIAVEYDEFADQRLQQSIQQAETKIDELVKVLLK